MKKINSAALHAIQDILDEMTADAFVSGANCLIVQNGKEQGYFEAGLRDIAGKKPMTRDTIFRLYSMTKPVTAAAVMLLISEGKLDLLDPISMYLPEFANMSVCKDGVLVPAARCITIHDLLNMTSGLSYGGEGNMSEMHTDRLFTKLIEHLDSDSPITTREFAAKLAEIPLAAQPGECWHYSTSADVLGAVIEVVSGMSFAEFLRKRFFEPLGMVDTAFYVPKEKQDRLAKVYRGTEHGLIEEHYSHLGVRNDMKKEPAFASGGAGLVSTVDDYARFTQMLLGEGYAGKKPIKVLSDAAISFLSDMHVAPSQQKYVHQWDSLVGYTYGALMRHLIDPGAAVTLGSKGEYGWDGWLGTYMANDPANRLTILLMYQKTDTGTTAYTRRIRNVVFSALTE